MKHLIKFDKDDYMHPSYYISEPIKFKDGSYGGGFGDVSKAIVFDSIARAHIARRRLSKMYSDIPAKMRVITMTSKELFKVRLGGKA